MVRAFPGEGSYEAPPKGETTMKGFWIFRAVIIVSTLAFAPVALPCHGQTAGHAMSVNVPFGFELGSQHFEPGTYTIHTPEVGVVEIQGSSTSAMGLTREEQSTKPTKTAKVVFDRYGDHYFLRQLWFNAEEKAYVECPESKAEKQAKRSELASISKKPSNVELAMLRLP
jgi:hypothetical protein